MKRALVVCPGRGSYDRSALGQLKDRSAAARAVIDACDLWRADHRRPTVTELDAAPSHTNKLHVAGENASLLTAACTLADLADLDREKFQVVAVVGNSMGFYTALGAAGALDLPAVVRLVDTMGAYQEGNVLGGQVLYPLVDEAWQPDPARRARVEQALQGTSAWWSIDLGSHAVLGGDEAGVQHLLATLPKEERGARTFPVRLPLHSAFHTPVMTETSARALSDLGDLPFGAPVVPLIDGRGVVFRPRWASPTEMRDYTLGAQVVAPFDFRQAVRTALRHAGPDVVVALGPGNSLGASLAAILVQEGWAGVRSKAAFEARQAEDPVLLAFGVPEQRARLV